MTLGPAPLLVATLDEAARRVATDPAEWIPWLPSQEAFFADLSKTRLYRAGNQSLGKSTALLADLLWHALGEHPYRPNRDEPGEYWIVTASWSQSVAVQSKLNDLLPPDRVHPETVFTSTRGFRGKNPCVQVRHVSGGWSVIRFKTAKQGTINLSAATIDGAAFDEPPTESVYAEIVKRVQARGGWVSLGLTPIGAPVDWLRDLVQAGQVTDLHAPLTPEALIPVGRTLPRRLPDGTLCDADWIRRIEAETPPSEVGVRVHGDWETKVKDRYYTVFRSSGPGAHVNASLPTGKVKVLIGVDHGHRPSKQVALLVAVQEATSVDENPRVWVLDEYTDATGLATPKEDAQGIIAMLGQNGLTWASVDWACGDRVHQANTGNQKSNKDLGAQLAKLLRVPPDALHPPMRTAPKPKDSPKVGCRWLFHCMSRPGHFNVNPKCKRTIEALERYLGPSSMDDEWHDPCDALRYALVNQIYSGWRSGPVDVRFG